MKSKGVLVRILMAIVCLLPVGVGLFSLGDSAFAADAVNVTLHKKKMDEFPSGLTENTGKIDNRFDRYKGLPDITFSVWNITDDFYDKLNAALTGSETEAQYKEKVKELMAGFTLNKGNATKAQTQDQITDTDGLATFSGLPMRNGKGLYNVYYFEEHVKPGVTVGQPLILTLPAIDTDNGSQLENIHLYPKNKVEGLEVEKEVIDDDGKEKPAPSNGVYDYEIGKQVKFRTSFTIPSQIGEILTNSSNGAKSTRYTRLEFKDRLDKTGVKFNGIEKITMGGTEIPLATLLNECSQPQYFGETAPYSEAAGFEIKTNLNAATHISNPANYNKSEKAAKFFETYAGQTMEIYYSVTLTEHTKVDEEIKNTFTVTLANDKQTEQKESNPEIPSIITGGKKVFKYEGGNGQGLGGAKFVVIKKDGNNDMYLKIDNGEVKWVAVGTNETYANATQYVSGDNGMFEIKGLEYGTYYLREIKAPDGFNKLDDDKDFEVSKGSFDDSLRVQIANLAKDGFLPSTGGAGIIAFLVVGLSLMGIAVFRYRKTQHAA